MGLVPYDRAREGGLHRRCGSSSFLLKQVGKKIGGTAIRLPIEVGVDVERCRSVAMPQATGDRSYIDSESPSPASSNGG